MTYDIAIIGAGPAGSACAAFCASGGLKTLLLERASFPREKVCGDCLNPACWPVLDRLGVSERILALPHSRLAEVEFIGLGGESIRFPLPHGRGEIAIKRSLLDQVLIDRAAELGADVRQDTAVTALVRGWEIQTTRGRFSARTLVAADGRNSTVARLLDLLPSPSRERVGLQTHLAVPAAAPRGVTLRFLPHGYCGIVPVGCGEINVCLVARPPDLAAAKAWATAHFALRDEPAWRTITPLARATAAPIGEGLLLVGDAARVVEPFTGEGIYYALATGELAAQCLLAGDLNAYPRKHVALYRGRLWINRLARFASLHPRAATVFLRAAQLAPGVLGYLTTRVVGRGAVS